METNKSIAWNDNFWDKSQTKAIQGICAVIIMLHHISQKTCASWIPAEYRMHGLEPFVSLGFLMVGVFFFCSGYGLYISVKAKDNYLNGFIDRHFRPIILIFIIANVVYFLVGEVYSGYNWYIYAILYLYVAFFISFRYFKKEAASIGVLTGFIALYIVFCDMMVFGTWCYNTVLVFLVGLLFAKYCDKIVDFIRRRYLPCLILCTAVLAVTFAVSEILHGRIGDITETAPYNAVRIIIVFTQFIAATAFSVLLFIISQRVRIRGRIFDFLGSMTLEIYMIHVLYVEMFGYCFADVDNKTVCYIRSLWLYVPIVLILSIASAYALQLIRKGANYVYTKNPDIFAAVRKDARKVLIAILIIIVGTTAITTINGIAENRELEKKSEKYKEENITTIHVCDTDIAMYITGEGDQTVMLLRGNYDPCPSLTLKYLADELAKDFRVVLVDLPGSGFSDDSTSERTAENICEELHAIATELKLNNYTLLAEYTSGLYAMYYVNKYPGEVKMVVNLDGDTAGLGRAMLAAERMSVQDYRRQMINSANLGGLSSGLLNYLGYRTLFWPIYEDMFTNSVGWQNYDVAYYTFFGRQNSKPIRNEKRHEIDNYLAVDNMQYPSDVKVIDFVSENRRKSYEKRGIDIYAQLESLCPNADNHKTVAVTDCMYCVLINPVVFRTNMLEAW